MVSDLLWSGPQYPGIQRRTSSSVWKASLIIQYVRMTKPRVSQGRNTFFLLIFHRQQVIQWMGLCIISCIIVRRQWQRRRKWCESKPPRADAGWVQTASRPQQRWPCCQCRFRSIRSGPFAARGVLGSETEIESSTMGPPHIPAATLSAALGSARR